MTYEQQIEVVAETIRDALIEHRNERYGDGHLMEKWDTLPDSRKVKYRLMAQRAIEVIRS